MLEKDEVNGQDILKTARGIIKQSILTICWLNYDCTCHAVRQEVHMRCPQGSIFTSLSFSAQILHSWKVEPISQYNSYCSWNKRKSRSVSLVWSVNSEICLNSTYGKHIILDFPPGLPFLAVHSTTVTSIWQQNGGFTQSYFFCFLKNTFNRSVLLMAFL